LAVLGVAPRAARAAAPAPAERTREAAAIGQELRDFTVFGSVLYVAAHPDDENTQLITYLAKGRGYRTAYLSLTRGDGGQNVLGPEFGDLLGVIRTQELLAARRIDGGRQFFSRARDFGYSKDYRQTLTKWDRGQVLSDIVRVIREFRPDIIVTRFPPEPTATHGHHTASAALALEAFKLCGDPKAFPEQLGDLGPWQPRRILWNSYDWSRPGSPGGAGSVKVPIDGTDPVTGASFATLAAKSRSMHRTQGFANFSVASAGTGPRSETFQLLAGEPASSDIMDGVDATWSRIPGGAEVGRLAALAAARLDPANPAALVPDLMEIRGVLSRLGKDPVVDEKRLLLDRIIQRCLGLTVSTRVAEGEVVPGEPLHLVSHVALGSGQAVRWVAVRFPGTGRDLAVSDIIPPAGDAERKATRRLPKSTPLSGPYWLRSEGTEGMFRVDDPSLIGRPENPPVIPVEYVFQVDGQELVVPDEALYADAGDREPRRPFVIPPVTLGFGANVALLAPGSARRISVTVTAARPGVAGELSLDAPAGWGAAPASQPFRLGAAGDRATLEFTLTAAAAHGRAAVGAEARVNGSTYSSGRTTIDYGHIPAQVLEPRARLWALSIDIGTRGHRVAYLPGAGDSTEASLEAMGYLVTRISGADLTAERLSPFDAVVIGVRAFNTRTDLAASLPALFRYAEEGGTVVEQYNTPGGLKTEQLAPYPLKLARDLPHFRVTDEKARVTFLAPADPALNVPNRITPDDFTGWVQERGLDFASEWDAAHFTPLLACSDPGEAPLDGALLVARHGKGYFVYTGLSFFRQLPAGVPGAYRLFANLVSLGK
jgi:LmbE family N-acetylglucosaminyl deacetylase